MAWLETHCKPEEYKARTILEVGSRNVNGSIRGHLEAMQTKSYVGVDIEAGPGVDLVANLYTLGTAWDSRQDVVLCLEVLEHLEDWRAAVNRLKALVKPGGLLIITTRRPGFIRHCHPHDYWRFRRDDLTMAFRDFQVEATADLNGYGVAIKVRKPWRWEGPCNLARVHPRAAPKRDLPAWLRPAWVAWAYRFTNPAVTGPQFQAPCCVP